jgi:hypothetical protein
MIVTITLFILALSIVASIKYLDIQFPKYWIRMLSLKALYISSFFDSQKTNFTTIVVIPFASQQFDDHYCKSV